MNAHKFKTTKNINGRVTKTTKINIYRVIIYTMEEFPSLKLNSTLASIDLSFDQHRDKYKINTFKNAFNANLSETSLHQFALQWLVKEEIVVLTI